MLTTSASAAEMDLFFSPPMPAGVAWEGWSGGEAWSGRERELVVGEAGGVWEEGLVCEDHREPVIPSL